MKALPSKKCSVCKKVLSLLMFYKNRHRKDVYSDYCKECNNKMGLKYRSPKKGIETRKKYRDKYIKTDKYKEYISKYVRRKEVKERSKINMKKYLSTEKGKQYIIKRRKKQQELGHKYAHLQVCRKLKKLPCQVCGTTKHIHGHHEDYSKPLDVMWLCAKHHAQLHRSEKSYNRLVEKYYG